MSSLEFITSIELGLIYGIVACGVYLTMRVLNIADLTCDGSFMLGAAGCAGSLVLGYAPVTGLLFGSLAGGMAGLCSYALNRYARIDALFSGILTSFMAYSVGLRLMGGLPNIPLETSLNIVVLIGSCLFVWGLISALLKTDFGLALRCTGQNKKLAMSYGVNPTVFMAMGLILANVLIGLAGGLFCQYQSFADISQGVGTFILSTAAVMMGEKMWPTLSTTQALFMCIVGSILYRVTIAFALRCGFLGLTSADLNLVAGALIIGIMLFRRRRYVND
ncbi:MAG: hypothetical protein WCK42_01515 [Myxococcaceae bacterium]